MSSDAIYWNKEAIIKLCERVNLLEGIIRQAELHEPTCPVNEKPHPVSGTVLYPKPCNCWLSQPELPKLKR